MNFLLKSISAFVVMLASLVGCEVSQERTPTETSQRVVHIIVGSVRATDTGEKIAQQVKRMVENRSDVRVEIVRIKDYALPFYTDEVVPASRKSEIMDPALRRWSDKVKEADAFVFVVPEYNSGYSAPVKNAIDSLYPEWANKPVALIGYSGGMSGGASMLAQLRQVVRGVGLKPVAADVKIPQSWKAFDEQGNLLNYDVLSAEVQGLFDELVAACSA